MGGFAENADIGDFDKSAVQSTDGEVPADNTEEKDIGGENKNESIDENIVGDDETEYGDEHDEEYEVLQTEEMFQCDTQAVTTFAVPVVNGNTIGENITDEFEDLSHLYSYENVTVVPSDKSPVNVEGYGDSTAVWFENFKSNANIVYKSATGTEFKKLYIEISGNVNAAMKWPSLEYSADGSNWTTLVASVEAWSPVSAGWTLAKDSNSGNAWQKISHIEKSVPDGAHYIRVNWVIEGNTKTNQASYLFRKAKLEVAKIGAVDKAEYTESFENLNYTDKCEGITVENGAFAAAANSVLSYKTVKGNSFKAFELTAEGVSSEENVKVYASDREGRKVDITDKITAAAVDGGIKFSGALESWVKSIEIRNSEAAVYSELKLSSEAAKGSDWLYIAEDAKFGESGDKFLAQVTVGNDAGSAQSAEAYLVVYNEGTPVKIAKSTADIPAGMTRGLTVDVPKSIIGEKTYAVLYVMTDIKSGILIGDEAVYKSENVKAESEVESEEVSDNVPKYYVADINNAIVDVYGKLPFNGRNKKAVLTVLNPDYDADSAKTADADTAINNILAAELDEDNMYTAAIRLRNAETKTYTLLANINGYSGIATVSIDYRRAEDMGEVWSAIAAAMKNGDKDALAAQLTKSVWSMLGVRSVYLENIGAADICNMIDGAPAGNVTATPEEIRYAIEEIKLLNMLKKGTAAELINKAATDETAADIIGGGVTDDETWNITLKAFKETTDTGIKSAAVGAVNGKVYASAAKFRESFAVALLNASIAKAQNNLGVRQSMSDFGSLFDTDYSAAYAKLSNTKKAEAETALKTSVKKTALKSLDDAAERFLKCCKDAAKSSSGGGGSSSGGSSGGYGGSKVSVEASTGILQSVPSNNVSAGTEPFMDIGNVSWARESILALHEKGIVSGRDKMRFEPNANVTREEFVKMLVGALEITAENATCKFDDVADDDWFADSVAQACGAGVVNGMTAQFFGAGAEITREEMAAMIYRAAVFRGARFDATENDFADGGAISDWANTAVSALGGAEIMNGKDGGRFEPKAFATRAEAAKVIYLTMKLCNR